MVRADIPLRNRSTAPHPPGLHYRPPPLAVRLATRVAGAGGSAVAVAAPRGRFMMYVQSCSAASPRLRADRYSRISSSVIQSADPAHTRLPSASSLATQLSERK